MLRFHKKWGVTIEAYSSIGAEGSKLHEDAAMKQLAETKGCSVAQLAIAWAIKRGTIALVKTVKEERLAENIEAAQIQLSDNEVAKIDALNKNLRMFDPADWECMQNMPYFK